MDLETRIEGMGSDFCSLPHDDLIQNCLCLWFEFRTQFRQPADHLLNPL
jgi:hypothetical protein